MVLTLLLCTPVASADSVPVLAQAPDVAKQTVNLEMMVVKGTTTNDKVDPKLRHLMKYFRNYKFTGFELIDTKESKLHDQTARTFTIEGNRKVTITLVSHNQKSAKLKVVILEGKGKKILDTTININRNGTFIVAGPKYKDGVLFLPIKVEY
jgi:hypothetical protein